MQNNWIIEDNHLDTDNLQKNESIFHVANGYIGVRGNFEEGYNSSMPSIRGTYINAFYDIVPITYGEKAYAFPETMQKIVNIIDVQTINLQIGAERFNLFDGEIKHFRRFVNLKEGIYTREIHWISPNGHELKITIKRVASFTTLELLAIEYTVEKINCSEAISLYSTINGNVENYTNPNDPRVGGSHAKLLYVVNQTATDSYDQILCETKHSKLQVAATTTHILSAPCTINKKVKDDEIAYTYTFDNTIQEVTLTKYTIFTDNRRHNDVVNSGINLLKDIIDTSFETICTQQKDYLDKFWQVANIELEGDDSLQQGIRFNVYQLLQSVGKDKYSNITAKGLSGEGYEGHYFWDTEIYMLPFFILCNPTLAKQLLTYRYTILDHARKRALELGHKKGAAYAWRTITGDECSAYFPAGTAQYHINGDIAYTYIQYYLATGDYAFVEEFGAEVIFETARIWLEIGHFHNDSFRIDAVTGPDEYTAIVNNNYYTNRLAQYNLLWAVKWYTLLKERSPEVWAKLTNKIQLTEEEITLFEKAAQTMYLPYDETLGISEQDDSFLSKAVWDFENTPKENYPLLLHYHPLAIYRYQVLKQADVVLSHFLLEDDLSNEVIKNSYDYYEKLTTHDSSLSCAVYSIMASKVGYAQKAYDYFIETARLDLDNTHNNTKDGLHTANMGGTWMSIVYGFAGVRIKEGLISFNPGLPANWNKLSFNLSYQGTIIHVCMTPSSTHFSIQEGQLKIRVYDTDYLLTENMPLELPSLKA